MRIIYGFILLAIIFLACFGVQSYLIMNLQSRLDSVEREAAQNLRPRVIVLSYTWNLSAYGPSQNSVTANCTVLNPTSQMAWNTSILINVQVKNETITWVGAKLGNFDPWLTENVDNIVLIYDSSLGEPLNVWLTPNWEGMYTN